MAVLGKDGKTGTPAPKAEVVSPEDKKAAKAAAAKRHAEKVKAQIEEQYKEAIELKDFMTKNGTWDKASETVKNMVLRLCKSPAERKASAPASSPVFNTLFGDHPKVGDKVTLEQAFNRTYKGKSTLDVWVKRWAEKGIIVDCVIDPKVMLNTTYTIKALPAA